MKLSAVHMTPSLVTVMIIVMTTLRSQEATVDKLRLLNYEQDFCHGRWNALQVTLIHPLLHAPNQATGSEQAA